MASRTISRDSAGVLVKPSWLAWWSVRNCSERSLKLQNRQPVLQAVVTLLFRLATKVTSSPTTSARRRSRLQHRLLAVEVVAVDVGAGRQQFDGVVDVEAVAGPGLREGVLEGLVGRRAVVEVEPVSRHVRPWKGNVIHNSVYKPRLGKIISAAKPATFSCNHAPIRDGFDHRHDTELSRMDGAISTVAGLTATTNGYRQNRSTGPRCQPPNISESK